MNKAIPVGILVVALALGSGTALAADARVSNHASPVTQAAADNAVEVDQANQAGDEGQKGEAGTANQTGDQGQHGEADQANQAGDQGQKGEADSTPASAAPTK